jgi:hypothetical protein
VLQTLIRLHVREIRRDLRHDGERIRSVIPLVNVRLLSTLALGLGLVLSNTSPAHAEEKPDKPPDKPAKATVNCEIVRGVVLCVVRIEPFPRATVKYAEALFAGTPKFLRAIKHKSIYTYDPLKSPHLFLGLKPTGHGEGVITVTVRTVSCTEEEGACAHQSQTVRTRVSVPKQ